MNNGSIKFKFKTVLQNLPNIGCPGEIAWDFAADPQRAGASPKEIGQAAARFPPCGGLRDTAKDRFDKIYPASMISTSSTQVPAKAQAFRRVSPVLPLALHPTGVLRDPLRSTPGMLRKANPLGARFATYFKPGFL